MRLLSDQPAPTIQDHSRHMQTSYEIPALTADFGDPEREIWACRNACALFDFSFVKRAAVRGHEARETIEAFASRSLDQMSDGKIRYALRQRKDGTVLSDLTLWKISDQHFEVMSGHGQDIRDLSAQGGSAVQDLSGDTAIFAVQGPHALEELTPQCGAADQLAALEYFEHTSCTIGGVDCKVGRLGYSGEAGFELICSKSDATKLWSRLAGNIEPAGFIAADTLRIEAGFPLFWNDFALAITAREAGLMAFSRSSAGSPSETLQRVCFSANCAAAPAMWRAERTPERPERPGEVAVTSACYSTRAGGVLGLGYVLMSGLENGARLFDPSGLFTDIRRQPLPFYDTAKARPRAAWR